MKQFKFQYQYTPSFIQELETFQSEHPEALHLLFGIYSDNLDREIIGEVCRAVEQIFPDAEYFACSTSGNIVDCGFYPGITVICTVFERPTTQVRLFQYEINNDNVEEVAARLSAEIQKNPWIKAVELYFNIFSGVYTRFCEGMSDVPEEVHIFGGVSCSTEIVTNDSFVLTKQGGYAESAVAVVCYGGEEFHIGSMRITGWMPLKRRFRVTSADGCRIRELDGRPAYEVYRRYLGIPNDDNFFVNCLEFPLLYDYRGTSILRTPVACYEDGSIELAADVSEGSFVRMAYGDPRTILGAVNSDSNRIRAFRPDLIHIFSCSARKAFWGDENPTYELACLEKIAPNVGFFTHGEFLRTNGRLDSHNVTLVLAGMREGAGANGILEPSKYKGTPRTLERVPLVTRMATFISAFSRELEEINNSLESVNQQLKAAAITDGLTRLYNRREIQSRIEAAFDGHPDFDFSLVMFDLDNFKMVNDTYGHKQGDLVIIALADLLRNGPEGSSAGRWGGEEFMLLLPRTCLEEAAETAERIRRDFEAATFEKIPSQTVSVGVTQVRPSDTLDTLCTRVDAALYRAKQTGKNQVVRA